MLAHAVPALLQAFELYSTIETALKDYEWDIDCGNQNVSTDCLLLACCWQRCLQHLRGSKPRCLSPIRAGPSMPHWHKATVACSVLSSPVLSRPSTGPAQLRGTSHAQRRSMQATKRCMLPCAAGDGHTYCPSTAVLLQENCRMWADNGECDKTPDYMHTHCKKACKLCTSRFKGARTRSEQEVHPLTVIGVMIASFQEEIQADAAKLVHETDTASMMLAAAPSSGAVAFKPSRRHAAAAVTETTGQPPGYVLLFNVQLVLLGVLLGLVARMGTFRLLNRKSA